LTDGQTVALDPAAVDIDAVGFEQAAARGAVDAAAEIYRGDLLEGLALGEPPFEDWLRIERARLRELGQRALAHQLTRQQASGALEQAVQTALRLLAIDQLQENVHRTLIGLYLRQGRRGDALKQYDACVAILKRELGAGSDAVTRRLYESLRGPRAPESPPPPDDTSKIGLGADELGTPETPLIGREPEMGRLRALLEEAAAGRGSVVTIVGEPGIGKSRLVQELALEAASRKTRVLIGRCYQSEQILAFGVWADAFRGGRLTEPLRAERLSPRWRRDLSRFFPELTVDAGDAGAPTDYLRLFEAAAHLIADLASRDPLLVLLEDIHWADEMSLRLLAYLSRRLATRRVLLVTTAREDEVADSPALRLTMQEIHEHRFAVTLALRPLSRQAVASLLRSLTRARSTVTFDARLEEDIWIASDGNPLMAVESLRTVHEGRISPEIAQTAARMPLPDRVRAVIAGRLERLTERGRALIAAAAVIGREFESDLLERAAGLAPDDIADGLDELLRRHLLHETRGGLDFTHASIREVAYGQLSLPRRRLLHGHVGNALQTLYAANLAPHYAAIGGHARAAGAWDTALTYLRAAGDQAAMRSAHREAVTFFEQALEASRHLAPSREVIEQSIDPRIELRKSLFPGGELPRMDAHLSEGERLAVGIGDQRRLARISTYRAHSFWAAGETLQAIDAGTCAVASADAVGDLALRAPASCYLAQACHAHGDYARAIGLLTGVVHALDGPLAHELFGMNFPPAGHARVFLAISLAEIGEFAEALARGQEARTLAEALEHSYGLFHAWWALGIVNVLRGQPEAAIEALERSLSVIEQRGMPLMHNAALGYLGHAYARAGRLDAALPVLERAFAEAVDMSFLCRHSLTLTYLADAQLISGDRAAAERAAHEALDLARRHAQRGHEACALKTLGDSLDATAPGQAARAEAAYREALVLASDLGMRPLIAHCTLALGRLYRLTAKQQEADANLASAKSMYAGMGLNSAMVE
jgi:tetratricopeptide (TPR) repeat protein